MPTPEAHDFLGDEDFLSAEEKRLIEGIADEFSIEHAEATLHALEIVAARWKKNPSMKIEGITYPRLLKAIVEGKQLIANLAVAQLEKELADARLEQTNAQMYQAFTATDDFCQKLLKDLGAALGTDAAFYQAMHSLYPYEPYVPTNDDSENRERLIGSRLLIEAMRAQMNGTTLNDDDFKRILKDAGVTDQEIDDAFVEVASRRTKSKKRKSSRRRVQK